MDLTTNSTAVLCFEMQRGVVGDLHTMSVIAEAVRESDLIAEIARLLGPVRAAGVPVIHLTAARRPDQRGAFANMPYVHTQAAADGPGPLDIGSAGAEVVPELSDNTDIVIQRLHGVSGFTDTGLDSMLRSLGVTTIILAGSSVNRGIMGLTIEGVNRGYYVVIPREAVTGYPPEYRDMVLKHSLQQIARVCTIDDVIAAL